MSEVRRPEGGGGRGSVFAPGLEAVRASWPPMVLIQLFAVFVVAGFYLLDPVRAGLESFGRFKDATGLFFIFGSGFLSGGVLPEVAKGLLGRLGKLDREWLGMVFFTGVVYACVGGFVAVLYWVQVLLFGPAGDWGTLVKKILFDQLVFSPLVSIPFAVGMFHWRAAGWRWSSWLSVASRDGYLRNVMPPLVMCWFFWGPLVACIYSLPEQVQFVVSASCQAAWSILFVFMVERGRVREGG